MSEKGKGEGLGKWDRVERVERRFWFVFGLVVVKGRSQCRGRKARGKRRGLWETG
jgi:hypothetical protein